MGLESHLENTFFVSTSLHALGHHKMCVLVLSSKQCSSLREISLPLWTDVSISKLLEVEGKVVNLLLLSFAIQCSMFLFVSTVECAQIAAGDFFDF